MMPTSARTIAAAVLLTCATAHAASKLTLDYPRGGELFVVGSSQTVRLGAKTRATSVDVELSSDGGATFSPLGTITVTKGVVPELPFTVAPPVSASSVVRVTATIKGKATSVMSGLFTIAPLPSDSFTESSLDSGAAANGYVLAADGSGGASWVAQALAVPQSITASDDGALLALQNSGAGPGIHGANTAATGSVTGVLGEAASTSHGTGATGGVSGVVGIVTPTTPGGYSAGVRGVNNGTGGTGIGVIGAQGGSGWGVYGETPSGFGVYGLTTNNSAASVGVRGETFSTNGIGVEAKYSGSGVGVALELDNGAIRVAGVNQAAFVHTATPANKLSANGTDVDNPLTNNDANAILIVTQKLNPSGIVYNNSPIGVYYNTIRNKWEIFNENNVAIPNNAQFNVLVIKR